MNRSKDEVRLLYTTQCRLRHMKGLLARNLVVSSETSNIAIYFTMHVDDEAPAFYTSEVLHDTVNPNWTNFNWVTLCEQLNTALPSVVFKLWQSLTADDHLLITKQRVVFKQSHYLGEQIPKDGARFRPNTLAFEMFQGVYACGGVWKTPVSADSGSAAAQVHYHLAVPKGTVRKSYDLSTLRRVRTVQRALKQTRTSVQAIRDRVHATLMHNLQATEMAAERKMLSGRLERLREELHHHRQRLCDTRQQSSDIREENRLKNIDIGTSVRLLRKSKDDLLESRRNLIDTRENLVKISAQLSLRRRQLISELGFIYPTKEMADKRGCYTICGVHLPNSEDFAGHDEFMISVGLGYVCHMVVMISQFLQVPPRYPVLHGGSRSRIFDHFLSTIPDSDREFPLYTRGTDKLHFQYGVYLLNKNIAQLRYYCGYPTFDLRCTLSNLKTLLELRPISKTEPTSPASIATESSRSIVMSKRRSSEEITGSLDPDGSPSHRRPLWRPSPECCRSATTLSVSLDHGLDELLTTVDGHGSGGGVAAATATVIATTELRTSEPSLLRSKTIDSSSSSSAETPSSSVAVTANGTVGVGIGVSPQSFGQLYYGGDDDDDDHNEAESFHV